MQGETIILSLFLVDNLAVAMIDIVYHVCKREDWQKFRENDSFLGSLKNQKNGFIHLSKASQLNRTLAKFFKGRSDLVCLLVRYPDIEDQVKWEGNSDLYPHLYGALPLSAVLKEQKLEVGNDDVPRLPDWVELKAF